MKIFGYEPVAIIGAVQATLYMLVAFGKLDFIGLDGKDDVAIVVGVMAAVEAVVVAYNTHETLLAPLTALLKAALALGVIYGFHVTDEQAATVITVITAFLAYKQRENVTAVKEQQGSFALVA